MSGSSGRWAGERFMKAVAAGRLITPAELRTLELMRNEERKVFDTQLIEGALEILAGVADLKAAGLTRPISNGLAKTVLEYDQIGDLNEAIVSMDGVTRDENDRLEFDSAGLPLPITHKDWYINLRALMASRTGSEPMDSTYIRLAGRKIGEKAEDMLFNGSKTFRALPIYGYTTAPGRFTASFGTGGAWSATAKTGDQILTDLFTLAEGLDDMGFHGPYWLYYGDVATSLKLATDFKAATSGTIRDRLLQTQLISKISRSQKLADDNIVLVQPAADVIQWVEGEALQNVQWDVHGGFQINFKGFQIEVPLIRTDIEGNTGIAHMS
jgi:uncharacterized linocin/CFP29 family protein